MQLCTWRGSKMAIAAALASSVSALHTLQLTPQLPQLLNEPILPLFLLYLAACIDSLCIDNGKITFDHMAVKSLMRGFQICKNF